MKINLKQFSGRREPARKETESFNDNESFEEVHQQVKQLVGECVGSGPSFANEEYSPQERRDEALLLSGKGMLWAQMVIQAGAKECSTGPLVEPWRDFVRSGSAHLVLTGVGLGLICTDSLNLEDAKFMRTTLRRILKKTGFVRLLEVCDKHVERISCLLRK